MRITVIDVVTFKHQYFYEVLLALSKIIEMFCSNFCLCGSVYRCATCNVDMRNTRSGARTCAIAWNKIK